MAERVCCTDDEVDEILVRYAEDWVLVAVLRTVFSPMRGPDEEQRELYFELKPNKRRK
jgi:hypothetical protein